MASVFWLRRRVSVVEADLFCYCERLGTANSKRIHSVVAALIVPAFDRSSSQNNPSCADGREPRGPSLSPAV